MTEFNPHIEAADAIVKKLRRAEKHLAKASKAVKELHDALSEVAAMPAVTDLLGGDVTPYSGGGDKPPNV